MFYSFCSCDIIISSVKILLTLQDHAVKPAMTRAVLMATVLGTLQHASAILIAHWVPWTAAVTFRISVLQVKYVCIKMCSKCNKHHLQFCSTSCTAS